MTKVTIKLTDGRDINLQLFPEAAPITVENFKKLVNEGFYDGLCFHRCIKNFMIQGGGFTPNGRGIAEKGGAATIKGEFAAAGVKNSILHEAGVISMARTNVYDSASSQFFICAARCDFLDGQYAAFGKTTDDESLNIVREISEVATHSFGWFDDIPNDPVVIKTVILTEN